MDLLKGTKCPCCMPGMGLGAGGQTEEIQIRLHPLESHSLQWRSEIQIHKPGINYFLGL